MSRELLMQNNYEWGTAEGQTLEIENAIRSNVRALKIEGQTYQNLVDENNVNLGNYSYDAGTGEYSLTNPTVGEWNSLIINYTRPVQAGEKLLIRINFVKNTIESTQTPPVKITYSDISSSSKGFMNVNTGFTGLIEYYCNGAIVSDSFNTKIEISTRPYTSGELVIKDIQVIPVRSNPLGSTELPTSINGIESVAEMTPNLYTEGDLNVKGTDAWIIVKKSVAVEPNTKYKISLDIESISKGSNNYSPVVEFYSNKKLNNTFLGKLISSGSLTLTTRKDTTTLVFAFVINAKTVSTTECEANFRNIGIYESDLYLVKIVQSHNETDKITLPNGVKNSIENGVYIRRIGKYTITGNEYYELRNENDSMFKIQCDGLSIEPTFGDYVSSDVKMICDKAKCEFCGDLSYVNNSLIVCGRAPEFKGFIIAIPKKLLTEYTLDKAKEYIKSLGGLTVWYQLATPITEPLTTTKIPLPQPLRSLPNGVCDEVVGNKLIQRVGEITPTSTNINWADTFYNTNKDDASTYVAHGSFNSVKYCVGTNINLICDKIPVGNLNAELLNYNIMVYNHSTTSKELRIAVPKTLLPNATIGEFKEWLDGNPVTLYYELETPIEHTINVPPISIAKGSNLISTANNMKPNLSIKYKKLKK